MSTALNFISRVIAVMLSAYLLPGIVVNGFLNILIVSLVIGILNTLVKPVLFIITLPINVLTLGLFNIVINTVIILLADYLLPGFNVANYASAFLLVLVLWIVDAVFHLMFEA